MTSLDLERSVDREPSVGVEPSVAHEPPEARGLRRDQVRLMVSRVGDDSVAHARFVDLPRFLERGDLLVVNASATIPAALRGVRRGAAREHGAGREHVLLHLSSPLDQAPSVERWVVELRRLEPGGPGHTPLLDAAAGEEIELPAEGSARLLEPYEPAAERAGRSDARWRGDPGWRSRVRLWVAELTLPGATSTTGATLDYLVRYGAPIRYGYVAREWPLPYYQTGFATEPGSAEMPSAGRPFTREVLAGLDRAGVNVTSIVLHTGVSSLDLGEPPYPERFRVPRDAAAAVDRTRAAGGRVIAVGTTVVRALESAASCDGRVHAAEGWTDLVVTAERGVRAVDGLITGLHSPKASHLDLLEAFADADHVSAAYDEASRLGYLWHEFGDSHLILR